MDVHHTCEVAFRGTSACNVEVGWVRSGRVITKVALQVGLYIISIPRDGGCKGGGGWEYDL